MVAFLLGTAFATPSSTVRLFLKAIAAGILFFAVIQSVTTISILRRISLLFAFFGWGAAALSVVLYFLPHSVSIAILSSSRPLNHPGGSVLRFIAGTDVQRAIGFAIDPNVLGAIMAVVCLVTLGLLVTSHSDSRYVILAGLAISLLALLLTYSRSSWLGLVSGSALFATLWLRRRGSYYLLSRHPQSCFFYRLISRLSPICNPVFRPKTKRRLCGLGSSKTR